MMRHEIHTARQLRTFPSPSTICSASCAVSTPALASALAYAWLPCSQSTNSLCYHLPLKYSVTADERVTKQCLPAHLVLYRLCERSFSCIGPAHIYVSGLSADHMMGLTLMSSLHMRLSNGNDSLNFSIRGSVAPVKRPPQSFFFSPVMAASFTA